MADRWAGVGVSEAGSGAWSTVTLMTTTTAEIVSAWVLGRFREGPEEVRELVTHAADETADLVVGIAEGSTAPGAERGAR